MGETFSVASASFGAAIKAASGTPAAAQYAVIQKDQSLEPYLDGLGFAIAARSQAKDILPWLRKLDAQKEKAVNRDAGADGAGLSRHRAAGRGESAGVRAIRCCVRRQAVSNLK